MPLPIEDYALIGDLHCAALVGSDGSIDWLCLPRFDSEACFAALLGQDRHGHWRIAPAAGNGRVRRRYRPDSLVLETEFTVDSGTARLVDCMPPREQDADPVLVRMVEGLAGRVDLRMTLGASFEYGSAPPMIHRQAGGYGYGAHRVAAGSQALWLFGPVHVRRARGVAVAEFSVSAGARVPFAMVWRGSRADRWRRLRAEVRAEVLDRGYDPGAATLVQAYQRAGPDASLLRAAGLGFLPPGDERLRGTAAAIARDLDRGGVLLRHEPDPSGSLDGLPPGDGGYLPATFWLAQCLAAIGRGPDARQVFTRLLEFRNDVGLLAEEYDPLRRRLAGNYPLNASHAALAEAAAALDALSERAGVRTSRAGR
jgi:GH15 family glucan-1,4-alpha-glucosidase